MYQRSISAAIANKKGTRQGSASKSNQFATSSSQMPKSPQKTRRTPEEGIIRRSNTVGFADVSVASLGAEPSLSVTLSSDIDRTVEDLDSKISNLRYLFRETNPLDDRSAAATALAAYIRGFLVRTRLSRYFTALREWKWSRCRVVIHVLEVSLDRAARLEADIRQMRLARETRMLHLIYAKWSHVCKQIAPIMKALREAAYLKGLVKDWELVGKVNIWVGGNA